MKRLLLFFVALILLTVTAVAQEFEIRNYDLKAKVISDANAVEVNAKMRLINLNGKELVDKLLLGTGDKPRLSFYLNPKTKITAMKISGVDVAFKTAEQPRLGVMSVYADVTSPIASMPEFDVEISYVINSERGVGLRVSGSESYLLPNSFWVPVNHNPYAEHGADTAPFTLNVTAPSGKIISSGNRKDENTFEQSLAAQPFFFVGNYEMTTATAAKNAKVEIYAPRGLDANGKQQLQKLSEEAVKIVNYYSEYFATPQMGAFRIVATSTTGISFAESGGVAIDESFFRRNIVDLGTIELLASAAARSFIDGRVLLRGRGAGMMRDGLPVYMTANYFGVRFGEAERNAAFERYRRAYEPLARGSDTALLMQSSYDRNYTTAMYNKGALVWRLIETKLGRATFDAYVRTMLDRQRVDVLSLTEWKAPLCRVARCVNVKSDLTVKGAELKDIFLQWIETVIGPDFAVGQPKEGAGGVESAIVNFGSGDLTVDVSATTESGEKINRTVAVKGGEYGTITFLTGTKISRIEVDPDKVYPQKDYSNDVYPRRPSTGDLYGQASLAFGKKEYAVSETKLKEALTADPGASIVLALLGRVQVILNKNDEAQQAFNNVLKQNPIPLQAFASAHLGLGNIALQKNQWVEAANHFKQVSASEQDQATTVSAFDGALKAEQGAKSIVIPEDVKAFIKQLDDALLQGTAEALTPLVETSNLREFVKRVTASKPTIWATEIMRTEAMDTERIIVDANVKVKIVGREGAGRAIYVLSRVGGKFKLSEVPVFDVK